jgi:hypothetical protein
MIGAYTIKCAIAGAILHFVLGWLFLLPGAIVLIVLAMAEAGEINPYAYMPALTARLWLFINSVRGAGAAAQSKRRDDASSSSFSPNMSRHHRGEAPPVPDFPDVDWSHAAYSRAAYPPLSPFIPAPHQSPPQTSSFGGSQC